MRRIDEVVVPPRHKERGHEAPRRVLDRRQRRDTEPGPLLHRGADGPKREPRDEAGHVHTVLSPLVHHLVRQHAQVRKRRVQHHGRNARVAFRVHDGGHRPHAPPPERHGRYAPRAAEGGDEGLEVILLEEPQRDVLPLREPRAGKVQRRERDAEGEAEAQLGQGLEARGGVPVQVHEARQLPPVLLGRVL